MTARPIPPAWTALAPLHALDADVYAPIPDVGGLGLHLAEVGDVDHPDAVADMIAAAPGWALLVMLMPRDDVRMVWSIDRRRLFVIRLDGEEEHATPLPLDDHGLPVMTPAQYRALAPLVGWPVAEGAS